MLLLLLGCTQSVSAEGDQHILDVLFNAISEETESHGKRKVKRNWHHRVVEIMAIHIGISGNIPLEVCGLNELQILELAKNELGGPIPKELVHLKKLKRLNLEGNSLTGEIPQELSQLTNLVGLYLTGNKLTDTIPGELSQLTMLKILDLSSNELTGGIPTGLDKLAKLRELNLSGNRLTGSIPGQLGGLSKLEILNLSNNSLGGSIPGMLGGKKNNLGWIYFSGNKLTGKVPKEICELPKLRMFDISNNLLECWPEEAHGDADHVSLKQAMRGEPWKLRGNPWKLPPAMVVSKGASSVRSFYKSLKHQKGKETIKSLKVVIMGTQGAGKTSLVRSLITKLGGQLPDEDHINGVGLSIYTSKSSNMLQARTTFYDLDGQVDCHVLHELTLSEGAVYVLVWNAKELETAPEGERDAVIRRDIMAWIKLLCQFAPRCTVMLVASHCDELQGGDGLPHWMIDRVQELLDDQSYHFRHGHSLLVGEPNFLSGVIAVDCRTESTGLESILKKLQEMESWSVPPTWAIAWKVIDIVSGRGSDASQGGGSDASQGGIQQCWVYRKGLYRALKNYVEEPECSDLMKTFLARVGAREDTMDNTIELMEESGQIIVFEPFIFLDVSWLIDHLNSILWHETNDEDLVSHGILRERYARELWGVENDELWQALHELLKKFKVALPFPREGVGAEQRQHERTAVRGRGDLVITMRLPEEPTVETLMAPGRTWAGQEGLKAIWKFHHGGALYGFPERVLADCFKVGTVSRNAWWRSGALLEDKRGPLFIITYSCVRTSPFTLTVETHGRKEKDLESLRFMVSSVLHTARDFHGVSWEGWVQFSENDELKVDLANHKTGEEYFCVGAPIIPSLGVNYFRQTSSTSKKSRSRDTSTEGLGREIPPEKFGAIVFIQRSPDV